MTWAQDFSAVGDTIGCDMLNVKFQLDDTTTLTSVEWDFGNGTTSTLFDPPVVVYPKFGKYTVSAIIDGNAAAPIVKPDYIRVYETIEAAYSVDRVDRLEFAISPTDSIHDTDPSSVYYYRYDYADMDSIIHSKTYIVNYYTQGTAIDTFAFPDTGNYRIRFTITNPYQCSDSVRRRFKVSRPDIAPTDKFVPGNVYSAATGQHYIINPRDPSILLRFQLFTRSGVLVYKTEAPSIYWDGRTNNGRLLGAGVYFFVLESIQGDPTGYYDTKGFIHLFPQNFDPYQIFQN